MDPELPLSRDGIMVSINLDNFSRVVKSDLAFFNLTEEELKQKFGIGDGGGDGADGGGDGNGDGNGDNNTNTKSVANSGDLEDSNTENPGIGKKELTDGADGGKNAGKASGKNESDPSSSSTDPNHKIEPAKVTRSRSDLRMAYGNQNNDSDLVGAGQESTILVSDHA
jgi:hypothetical protein